MADEFLSSNPGELHAAFAKVVAPLALQFRPHADFKLQVPKAIGLIRTGDTTQYANMIIESA